LTVALAHSVLKTPFYFDELATPNPDRAGQIHQLRKYLKYLLFLLDEERGRKNRAVLALTGFVSGC
jgi:hypothetical protein